MSKKNLGSFFVIVFCLFVNTWMNSSCQKVVLPVEEERLEEIEDNDGDVSDEEGAGIGDDIDEDSFSVGSLIAAGDSMKGMFCIVRGYVVGYTTRTMKNTVFSSEGAVRTNVVIADSPKETDYQKCIPVELKDEDVRLELSLADHPEKLGRRAKFSVLELNWNEQEENEGDLSEEEDVDVDDEDDSDTDVSEDSSVDDDNFLPDEDQENDNIILDTLLIDTTGMLVPGGRML